MVVKVLNLRIERSRRLISVSDKNGRSLGFAVRKGNNLKDLISIIKIISNKIKH